MTGKHIETYIRKCKVRKHVRFYSEWKGYMIHMGIFAGEIANTIREQQESKAGMHKI